MPPERGGGASETAEEASARFVERLTACQGRLFAFIYALTADPEIAKDTLQQTNRALWSHASEYDAGREFFPWARAFAFNQVRAARTRHRRERLVFREDGTLRAIADRFAARDAQPEGDTDRLAALEVCLGKLAPTTREAIDRYYQRGEEVREIARLLGRRANTVAVMLHRTRIALADCIRAAVARQHQTESST